MTYRCHGERIYNTKYSELKNSRGYYLLIVCTNSSLPFFVFLRAVIIWKMNRKRWLGNNSSSVTIYQIIPKVIFWKQEYFFIVLQRKENKNNFFFFVIQRKRNKNENTEKWNTSGISFFSIAFHRKRYWEIQNTEEASAESREILWPAKMSGMSARWSFVNQSVILKISYNRPRRSYITEPVTIDPIYNRRKRCKISGLVSLSNRFIFLISCRPPFIFIAYRMQFWWFPERYNLHSTNTYIRISLYTYGAISYSSKFEKDRMFKKD